MSTTGNDAGASRASATPQFLNKLIAMVDDPATDRFIKWSDDGTSFYVFNPDQFAKELLGTYYKTDASASFVRQLNMYGFHKVPHVRQGALKSDKQAQAWHYRNPNFRRGRPDLLQFITRKGKNASTSNNLALQPIKQGDNDIEIDLSAPMNNTSEITSTTGEVAAGSPKNIDMAQIINGLSTIKRHQTLISDNLKELQSSNQALWQEAMEARERHRKHQDTINRILKFLASLFQGTATTPIRTASMSSNGSGQDNSARVVPAPRLLIKNVPEQEDDHDHDDRDSTPMSSVRLEEIELLDDDIPHKTEPTATLSPTVETPLTMKSPAPLPSAQIRDTSNSAPPTQSPNQAQNQAQVQNQPQYVFPDQNNMFAGGNYIPQSDAWKMLQWLQQNQIYIPGVTYPNQSVNNTGALTTLPPGGLPFNFPNAFNAPNGQSNNMAHLGSMGSMGHTQYPNNGNVNDNQTHYVTQQPSNAMTSVYPANTQLFNSLMPLASIANDPNPSVSMADVAQHGDKLDQLSNNVEAMQHGIDSLIEGMGLDPLSAASLRDGQDPNKGLENGLSNGLSGNLNGIENVNDNTTSIMNDTTGTNGNGNPFQIPPPIKDNAHNHPQTSLLDFDLDSLLKQLGAAAAANTPPHISALTDFSQAHNNPFDSAMFNDMDMFPPNLNGNMDYTQSQSQDQNQNQGHIEGQSRGPSHSHPQSFSSLEEMTSPIALKRSGSSEPSLNDNGAIDDREVTPSRSPGKKRKASTETWALDEATSTSAPASNQPKQGNRGSKRRK